MPHTIHDTCRAHTLTYVLGWHIKEEEATEEAALVWRWVLEKCLGRSSGLIRRTGIICIVYVPCETYINIYYVYTSQSDFAHRACSTRMSVWAFWKSKANTIRFSTAAMNIETPRFKRRLAVLSLLLRRSRTIYTLPTQCWWAASGKGGCCRDVNIHSTLSHMPGEVFFGVHGHYARFTTFVRAFDWICTSRHSSYRAEVAGASMSLAVLCVWAMN